MMGYFYLRVPLGGPGGEGADEAFLKINLLKDVQIKHDIA